MNGTKKRILVADDELAARMLVRRRLEAEGYDVALAEDGKSALAEIARARPDLVVLDVMMPNVDGLGVVADLRSRPETARLPVILVSAQGSNQSTRAGSLADAYFPKPIDFSAMVGRIEGLLGTTANGSASPAAAPGASAAAWTPGTGGIIGGGPAGLVAFVGAKGGVGTTTLAANAAVALAEAGRRTILVEAASFHGTLPAVLGLPTRRRLDRLALTGQPLDPTVVAETLTAHPSRLNVLLGPSGTQAPPPAEGVIALIDALRLLADDVLVDLDSATGVFGQVILRAADRIWVVTAPEATALDRAEALIQTLEQWGVRPHLIGLLLNHLHPTVAVDPAAIAQQTGREVKVGIPAAPELCYEASQRRLPVVALPPNQPVARALRGLAAALTPAGRSVALA
jgi:CheY-like chemotaxis protein